MALVASSSCRSRVPELMPENPAPRIVRPKKPKSSRPPLPPPRRRRRRLVEGVLVFIGSMVLLDSLFGERGIVEMMKKRQEGRALQQEVDKLRSDNERLLVLIDKLQNDPATIEDAARRELGLIKPGEKVFTIRDLPPGSR
jgi:cell division protein FtsB